MVYIESMGFGRDPVELLAKPSRSAEALHIFAQSMTMVAEGLGKKIENLTTKLEVATANNDIAYLGGLSGPEQSQEEIERAGRCALRPSAARCDG